MAIGGPLLTGLFVFHNALADGEIHGDLGGVDTASNQGADRKNDLPNPADEVVDRGVYDWQGILHSVNVSDLGRFCAHMRVETLCAGEWPQ
jgi:hypothetical protein